MEQITMADVAKKILGNSKGMQFSEIFEETKKILYATWRAESSEEISDEDLLVKKQGEMYKLFTIDGRFFRNSDGTWTAIRPKIINKDKE